MQSVGIDRIVQQAGAAEASLYNLFGNLFGNLFASAEALPGSPTECAANRYRHWVRTMFTDLAREAGLTDAEGLARQLHLLYDGAGVSARMDHDPSAATTARAAAALPYDAAVKEQEAADAR